ncbi:MAG TPA: hypothetical protein VLC46_10695 [Thermoanaerobaculia bacterium]|jgi:hypothetical protein|nr:hypothetical protein [Thermoanaerobaculia bacterium]
MSNTTPVSTTSDAARLTPDAVIAQLRTILSQIDDVAPLPKEQATLVKQRLRMQPKPIIEASINVIGVLDNVSQAIGQPLDEVRQLQDDSLRWDAVGDEARAFLKVIDGGNLIRHQRLGLIAMQAYAIGTQLAKDPDNAVLVPHVEEVKRLKVASRRKKTRQAPQTPAPASTPAHETSTAPKT